MKTVFHQHDTRGHADHGWLNSYHTFSFANYYNPERVHFGALRVLNDDTVMAGRGFGTHPHDNMEIISIPLAGDLEHKDSMGNEAIIREGDVQVMSAGTGIFHSEFNRNKDREVKFLQIWLFPDRKSVTPRYDQISLRDEEKQNELYQILSPDPEDAGVWIYQQAWFHMGKFTENKTINYALKNKQNGLYVFIIEGKAAAAGQEMGRRDGLEISDTPSLTFEVNPGTQLLLMEVPMNI